MRIEFVKGSDIAPHGYFYINIGLQCADWYDCKYHKGCKYKPKTYMIHNFTCDVKRFIYKWFHVELPTLVICYKDRERLSGTYRCPHHLPKNPCCYECKYICGDYLRECNNDERNNRENYSDTIYDSIYWGQRCKFYEEIK